MGAIIYLANEKYKLKLMKTNLLEPGFIYVIELPLSKDFIGASHSSSEGKPTEQRRTR